MKALWQFTTLICFIGLAAMVVAENYAAACWAFIAMFNAFAASVFVTPRKISKLSIEGVKRHRSVISRIL